jgi:hypothetical protein
MKKRTNESAQCANANKHNACAHAHKDTNNMDIDQRVHAQRVLYMNVSEIKSLSLQKLVVIIVMGFSNVPSPLLTLLLVMVVVVIVIFAIQE